MTLGNAAVLDMVQLDEVVGGLDAEYGDGYNGWANSSRFLNEMFGDKVCKRYSDSLVLWKKDEVKTAWKLVGVEVKDVRIHRRRTRMCFKIDGVEVSAQQAFEHAMNFFGKHLPEYSWCW